MVQIVEKEEKSPILTFKLKFVYSVILLTAIVVIYMLTFGEDGTSYQNELIYTDVNVPKSKSKEDIVPVVQTDKSDSLAPELKGATNPPTTKISSSSSEYISDNNNNFVSEQQQQQLVNEQTQQNFVQQPQPQQPPAEQPAQQPAEQPAAQPAEQPAFQQPLQPAVQPAEQPALQPAVQPAVQPAAQPAAQAVMDTSQCPKLDMSSIHDRITQSCEIDRFKNNWIELVSMYDIPPRHLLYDVDRNYVWVTVPKIASSNIKRVIIKEKLGYSEDSEQMKQAMKQPHVYLSKCCLLTVEVARKFYSLQRAFTFTFIRNPWTRLYSAYRDKIVMFKAFDNYYYIRKILFTVREWSWDQVKVDEDVIEAAGTITFTDFLTMLSKTDAENYNDHWKPWFLLTQPCMIKYDYIGYLEDISSAYQVVKDKVFKDLDMDLGSRYKTSSNSAAVIQAYTAVPNDVLDIVYNKFEDDFVIGGYSRDINCISDE